MHVFINKFVAPVEAFRGMGKPQNIDNKKKKGK